MARLTPALAEELWLKKSPMERQRRELTAGLSEAEMGEALQSIFGEERAGRASIARLMGAGGAAFDPGAFARATAPLRGGTQRAIGGLHARSAQMARQGLWQFLQMQQRRREQRAASRQAAFGGIGSLIGAFSGGFGGRGGFGGGGAAAAGGGFGGGGYPALRPYWEEFS